MRPGTTHLSRPSMIVEPAGTTIVPLGPMALIRLPVTTIVLSGTEASAAFRSGCTTVAPTMATDGPTGLRSSATQPDNATDTTQSATIHASPGPGFDIESNSSWKVGSGSALPMVKFVPG